MEEVVEVVEGDIDIGDLVEATTLVVEVVSEIVLEHIHCNKEILVYSHLSNKHGAHAYRFRKIPPSTKQKSTLHVY